MKTEFNCTNCKTSVVDTRHHVPNFLCIECEKIEEANIQKYKNKLEQQSSLTLTEYCDQNDIELPATFRNLEIA